MLRKTPLPERAADLNDRFDGAKPEAVLTYALETKAIGEIAMVSSFGAESVVLLHMLAQTAADTPVLFIDTEMLFPETTAYQLKLTQDLGLTNLHKIGPDRGELIVEDNESLLHLYDADACCALRKTRPLQRALHGFDGWITGRKRFQGTARARLDLFEAEPDRLKINPLAHWSAKDLQSYITGHDLPRHPLVAQGYPSLGCVPCTTRVATGEDQRAGRWRGKDKSECGIHFVDGQAIRGPL